MSTLLVIPHIELSFDNFIISLVFHLRVLGNRNDRMETHEDFVPYQTTMEMKCEAK